MKKYLTIFAISAFLIGCAKNRDVERVRQGDKENIAQKTAFLGGGAERDVWLTKATVVDTSNSPGGTTFIGLQGEVKIGYFDFNETTMNFRSLAGLQEGQESETIKNPVLLTWDIEHMDFTLDETDGQTTNRAVSYTHLTLPTKA